MAKDEKVANEKEKETPQAEPNQPETTEKETTEVGAVAKETPEPSDRFDKHPRFQELNQRVKLLKNKTENILESIIV